LEVQYSAALDLGGKGASPQNCLVSHRDTEESAEPFTDTGLGPETADAPRDADAPSAADTPHATDAPSAADAPRAADVPSAGDPPSASAGDAPSNVTAAIAEDRKKEPPRATNR